MGYSAYLSINGVKVANDYKFQGDSLINISQNYKKIKGNNLSQLTKDELDNIIKETTDAFDNFFDFCAEKYSKEEKQSYCKAIDWFKTLAKKSQTQQVTIKCFKNTLIATIDGKQEKLTLKDAFPCYPLFNYFWADADLTITTKEELKELIYSLKFAKAKPYYKAIICSAQKDFQSLSISGGY